MAALTISSCSAAHGHIDGRAGMLTDIFRNHDVA
jgi:hypothetical protein